jgi:hypothetical protein
MITTIRDDDDNVLLNYKGPNSPFKDFDKSNFEEHTYCRVVKKKDLQNAYTVVTLGMYRGIEIKVFSDFNSRNDIVQLAGIHKDALLLMDFIEVNTNWFMKEVKKDELDEIWEERSSVWGLPMPQGLEAKKAIHTSNNRY